MNLSRSAAAKTMREFDDATIAPMMGTATADEYYAQSSSSALLVELAVPTLFLSAANDPICPAHIVRDVVVDALPSEPPILLAVTPEGGHSMVWPTGARADGAWSIDVLCEWVAAICEQPNITPHLHQHQQQPTNMSTAEISESFHKHVRPIPPPVPHSSTLVILPSSSGEASSFEA